LEGLVNRNVRWLANALNIDKLPGIKSLFSKMLEGEVGIAQIKVELAKHDEDGYCIGDDHPDKIKEVAQQWGFKIRKALVTDISIPEELVKANVDKQKEEAQKISEKTQNDTLLLLMKEMKKEFPELTDKEVLDAVQVDRKKATRHIIDGTADPVTKAGALIGALGGGKK